MSISITDRAINRLKSVASSEGVNTETSVLRVAVKPGGCSGLTYDLGWDTTVLDSDVVTMIGEIRIVVDPRSDVYIDGTELDFTDGLEGQGFHFQNPQAARTCACGESFGL
ncbi:MAG: iron-sulfur cluster assembly accessory protein [Rhodothermales bacterium]|nr:iron-sulfur cluster assembly accessory protein [Rhodothermales bacterium]